LIAVPVLVLLTVIVVFQMAGSPSDPPTVTGAPSGPGGTFTAAAPTAPMNGSEAVIASAIGAGNLPAGPDFASTGPGTWHTVAGTTPARGTGGRAYTYTVEVEDGLQSADADQAFAAAVDATLADPRSWIGGGQVTLQRVDSGDPSFRISLTSQMTVRSPELCGWDVPLEASCFNKQAGRVLINNARWSRGAVAYGTDIDSYRSYAVNHEVGHALGFSHQPCPQTGGPAPVMMQQSWSTANDDLTVLNPQLIPADGKVCLPNPYPFPDAAPASAASASAPAG
jgi:hypothetical protein